MVLLIIEEEVGLLVSDVALHYLPFHYFELLDAT